MRVLAISGSLRAASHNTALLRAAAQLAPEGVEVELYDGLDRLPPFNEDHESDLPFPEVARLRDAIASADAVLISTPEYNGTVPGQLKHAIDWGSRPYGPDGALWSQVVAVIGASSTDYGAMWAQDHLRKALGIAGARVVDAELPVGRAQDRFDGEGALADLETAERLREVLDALVSHRHELAQAA
jgi:chromate reductase, NAD(P)H dehydrogenase (quinone)